MIFEIAQVQPQEFGLGFAYARVWVNQTSTPKVFFGDFAAGDTTIANGDNAALEICGVFDSTSPSVVSSSSAGYFDLLNFVWFQGARGLFTSTTGRIIDLEAISIFRLNFVIFSLDASCLLQGLVQDNEVGCLQCANEYFLQDNINCVSAPSNSSYFLHSPTNSYQSNYKP